MTHRQAVTPYSDRLLAELEQIRAALVAALEHSQIDNTDPNRRYSDILVIGHPLYGWAGSDEALLAEGCTVLPRP